MASSRLSYSEAFFSRLADPRSLLRLFDFLPHVYFYAKDKEHRFVAANQALAELRKVAHPSKLLGKTDAEFHAEQWGKRYQEENLLVMRERREVSQRIWLISDQGGRLIPFSSSKLPLFDRDGECIGIAGIMHPVDQAIGAIPAAHRLEPVLTMIAERYSERLDVDELAAAVNLSASQLNRLFQLHYQLATTEYVQRFRVHLASQQLIHSAEPIGAIALATGFYDQAHFTRVFKRWLGVTPKQYRSESQDAIRAATSFSGKP
jgi:AraC-like DNA-binding protein